MFNGMTKQKKLDNAKKLFSESIVYDTKWQREAREDFMFRDGYQWTSNERRILQEEMRPVLTFNLTKSSVDLIMGMNEDNKVVFRCSPVDPTDGFLCEVLNDLTYWIQENNRFADEEDDALESGTICGRGYVGIDFAPDPKRFGDILMKESSIPVHEIHFDPSSRRRDLSDAAYIFWDRWYKPADFKVRYPKIRDKKIEDFIALTQGSQDPWGVQSPMDSSQMHYDIPVDYTSDTSDYDKPLEVEFFDKNSRMIRVVHMEYWEAYKRSYLFIPDEKRWEEITGRKLDELKVAFAESYPDSEFIVEDMMDKKVSWLEFIGNDILYDDDSPLPFKGFSICPTFVYGDASKKTNNHFGVVRLMKDPQREVNKRWSQALNMLNQQIQPGVFAETDAFVDLNQAEKSMKEAGSISWVNPGGLNKIKERTVPRFPDAPMQMEQFSQEIIKKITGINPDLLGQDRGRQEPGVVVRLRQQQGVVLLKPLFKAFNNMKKDLFLRQLSIIMEYMPDEQILRILGSSDRYAIDPTTGVIADKLSQSVANIRDVRNIEYNVIAEESSGNMSKRMLELTALMEMQKSGFPVDPMQIIEKMNIPESDKQRWLQYIQSQQQAAAEAQSQAVQAEVAMKDRELTIEEKKVLLEFLVDISKIKQMAEKDEKKMVGDERNRKLQAMSKVVDANTQERKLKGDMLMQLMDLAKQYESELKGEQNNVDAQTKIGRAS